MDIFISYLGTDIPKNFRTKIHNNEKEFLGRLAEMVLKADDLFKQWAVASLGKIVFVNGGLGCVNVSSEKAVELPKVKAELETLIGSVSMGVGTNMDESWIACEHGAKNGGGKIVLYELGMEKEDSSKDLSKAEPKKKLEPENKENPKEIKDPPADVPTPLLDDNVGGQDVPPSGAPEGEDEEPSAIQMIAQALTDVKQHAQTIEKLRSVDPQAFEAVKNIISAMILMANNMMEMKQAAEPQADPADERALHGGEPVADFPLRHLSPHGAELLRRHAARHERRAARRATRRALCLDRRHRLFHHPVHPELRSHQALGAHRRAGRDGDRPQRHRQARRGPFRQMARRITGRNHVGKAPIHRRVRRLRDRTRAQGGAP